MSRSVLKTALLAATFLAFESSAAHAAWTRSWVVEWFEPANYFGAKEGVIDPGTDCPGGTNNSRPEIDWVKVLVEAGYTREEAEWLRNPANPTRSAVNGQNQMAFRGKNRANVYIDPTSFPETGNFKPVTGQLAEGINLDGDETTGFTGLKGEKGIDNNFYRAVGCWKTYRGPERLSSGALQFNDTMRNGSYTLVLVASGAGSDPMNDPNVTFGIYNSPDKLVKDGMGNVARDYTFRVKPDAKLEAIFKARTVNGRIESTEATDEVWMRNPGYDRELQLLKARVNFEMKADGTIRGYVGGYRPWYPVYVGWVNARGPVIESLTWVSLPDVYYAFKRYADYSPAGANGEKTHISFALRVEGVPAYVMTPDAKTTVASVDSYKASAPRQAAAAAPESPFRAGNTVDGIVVGRGQAVSQTPDQLRPPAQRVAAGTQ